MTTPINKTVKILSDMLAKVAIKNNLLMQLQDLRNFTNSAAQVDVYAEQLSALTNDMGDISSGTILALSSGGAVTDSTATGSFVSAEGAAFAADTYNIGGVSNGALQFGLSATTGAAFAGGGAVVIDAKGITLNSENNASIIRLTNPVLSANTGATDLMMTQTETIASETRVFEIGMKSNGVNPEGYIGFYEPTTNVSVPNGDFATGDLTNWAQVTKGYQPVLYASKTFATTQMATRIIWDGADLYLAQKATGIFKYSGGAWTDLNIPDMAYVNDMKFVGTTLYACGMNNSSQAAFWKRYAGGLWIELSIASTASEFYCIDSDAAGNVYVGGNGRLPTNSVYKYNGSTLTPYGTGVAGVDVYGLKVSGTGASEYLYVTGGWTTARYATAVRRVQVGGTSYGSYGTLSAGTTSINRNIELVGTTLYLVGQDGVYEDVAGTFTQRAITSMGYMRRSFAVGAGNDVYMFDSTNHYVVIYNKSTYTLTKFGAKWNNGTFPAYPCLSYNSGLYYNYGQDFIYNSTTNIYSFAQTADWVVNNYASVSSIEPGYTVELKTLVGSGVTRISVVSGNSYTFSARTFGTTGLATAPITLTVQAQFYSASSGGTAVSTTNFITRVGADLPWVQNSSTFSASANYVEIHVLGTAAEGYFTIGVDDFTISAANVTELAFKDSGLYYTDLAKSTIKLGSGGGGTVSMTNSGLTAVSQGAVVIINTSAANSFKTTTIASDQRVFGVVKDASIGSGIAGNIAIGGSIETVQVTGNVAIGNALVSSTTAGMAKANGGARQDGLIGFAVTSYSGGGTGTVQAIISPEFSRASAAVVVEGYTLLDSSNIISGTLQCGTNPNRLVIAVGTSYSSSTASISADPIVAGVTMTQTGSTIPATPTWANNSYTNTQTKMYYYKGVGTGSLAITSVNTTTGAVMTAFVALSGVNASSYLGTMNYLINTTTSPSVNTTDAVPGDLVLGFFFDMESPIATTGLVSSRGAGQTNIGAAAGSKVVSIVDTKTATAAAETMSWGLTSSKKCLSVSIPIRPA